MSSVRCVLGVRIKYPFLTTKVYIYTELLNTLALEHNFKDLKMIFKNKLPKIEIKIKIGKFDYRVFLRKCVDLPKKNSSYIFNKKSYEILWE